jgi:hypothetical protein
VWYRPRHERGALPQRAVRAVLLLADDGRDLGRVDAVEVQMQLPGGLDRGPRL